MATSYDPYYSGGWQSGEEGGTPITPDALNHMDDGIAGAYDYTQQSTAITDISSDITASSTYVDATTTVEKYAYRQSNVVTFQFTFRAAAQSVSGQTIFSGLPVPFNNRPFQFTALNVTSQKAVEFAVSINGNLAYWYSNNGFAVGDQIRGSVTYICAE